jgi:hypothetical protein
MSYRYSRRVHGEGSYRRAHSVKMSEPWWLLVDVGVCGLHSGGRLFLSAQESVRVAAKFPLSFPLTLTVG